MGVSNLERDFLLRHGYSEKQEITEEIYKGIKEKDPDSVMLEPAEYQNGKVIKYKYYHYSVVKPLEKEDIEYLIALENNENIRLAQKSISGIKSIILAGFILSIALAVILRIIS